MQKGEDETIKPYIQMKEDAMGGKRTISSIRHFIVIHGNYKSRVGNVRHQKTGN